MADRTKWLRDAAFVVSVAAFYRLIRGRWWAKRGRARGRAERKRKVQGVV